MTSKVVEVLWGDSNIGKHMQILYLCPKSIKWMAISLKKLGKENFNLLCNMTFEDYFEQK